MSQTPFDEQKIEELRLVLDETIEDMNSYDETNPLTPLSWEDELFGRLLKVLTINIQTALREQREMIEKNPVLLIDRVVSIPTGIGTSSEEYAYVVNQNTGAVKKVKIESLTPQELEVKPETNE